MLRRLFTKNAEDPAVLAYPQAEATGLAAFNKDNAAFEDMALLATLENAAERLGFLGCRYFVDSNRSLSIPVSWDRDKNVSLREFWRLQFEGKFETFSLVEIGHIIGGTPVRALCLSFSDVTLLPSFDSLPDDHLLYAPVLAVETIGRQAA